MTLSAGHIIGIALALAVITAVGVYSGKKVKNAADFASGGGKAGSVIVAGTIMGTLVGGSSTIGTAQLAYSYGLSAWWFTLGAGIGCLVLALGFVKPLRRAGSATITGMISSEYGRGVGMTASVLSSVGIFINIIAQLMAAMALITAVFPNFNGFAATAVSAALMALYVIFGGVWGTGLVGVVKLLLLYAAVILGGVVSVVSAGGFGAMAGALDSGAFFNLFARGFGVDAGAGLSLVLGVLATQTYAQAVLAGRSDREARKGALISACMIPPIGIGGILVGLFMRMNYPDIIAKQAFPLFVLNHMPALVGGIVLATLLIAVVGTGAGLALGVSTILSNDILKRAFKGMQDAKKALLANRLLIVAVLAAALIVTLGKIGDLILGFAFMSMGLRAAVVFAPMCGALFFKGRIRSGFALSAVLAGPALVLAGKLLGVGFDPLFIGLGAAVLIMLAGLFFGRKNTIS